MRKRFRRWRWRRRGIPVWIMDSLEYHRARGWRGTLVGKNCSVRTFPAERIEQPVLGESYRSAA